MPLGTEVMRSSALTGFLKEAAQNQPLQERLRQVRSLRELTKVAEAAGHPVEVLELQLWAHCEAFKAPWWPWAESTETERLAFFRQATAGDKHAGSATGSPEDSSRI